VTSLYCAMFGAWWSGWIREVFGPRPAFQPTRHHPSLEARNRIGKINFFDLIHLHERQGDPTADRDATADIAVPCTACGNGNLILFTNPKDFLTAIPEMGKNDNSGLSLTKPLVPLVLAQFL